jgi:hypothetical protein
MYIQFKNEFEYPEIIKVNRLCIQQEAGSDEQGKPVQFYSIVESSIYSLQDVAGVVADDLVREITGHNSNRMHINHAGTFTDSATLGIYDTAQRVWQVFREITKAIADGQHLYVMPEDC